MLHDILLPIRRRLFLSAVALSLGWGATPAGAQADDIGAKASIELLVPRNAVKPGETFPVGVKFTLQPGWHIYWKNPGDSGAGQTRQ